MHNKGRFPNAMFAASWRPESAVLAIMLMLLFLMFVLLFISLTAQSVQAQTFTVIHNFTGGQDGGGPEAGLTIDRAGNLYGTTVIGGYVGNDCDPTWGCGTVFKLSKGGSGWVLTTIYKFQGGTDGFNPWTEVIFGPDGNLYGTTLLGGGTGCGGGGYGCGTVFQLRPSATACATALCSWTETVLHSFNGEDGERPQGPVIFDSTGNLYGTTNWGGDLACHSPYGCGVLFELTPSNQMGAGPRAFFTPSRAGLATARILTVA